MTSQIVTSTIISTLIITLALLLSEQKSLIVEYGEKTVFYLKDTIWDALLQKGGNTISCRIAQFGALVLLRKIYTEIISPLHVIVSTYGSTRNLKLTYGSWGVIAGDLDMGDRELMREFAKDFIRSGMNVLILNCSLVGGHKNNNEKEEKMRNDVVKLFLEDLRQFAAEEFGMDTTDHSTNSGSDDKSNNSVQVDYLGLRDGTLADFSSQVTTKLGDIAKSGGIGILCHCFSSNQVCVKESKEYYPSYKHYGVDKIVSILNLILPYMIFRGIGAVINVCQEDSDTLGEDSSVCSYSKTRGVAECAFYTQLIRSLHYEYGEHGVDCLAVTLGKRRESFDARTIVRSSLQILGEESELDLKVCRYIEVIKTLYKQF